MCKFVLGIDDVVTNKVIKGFVVRGFYILVEEEGNK